MVEIVHAIRWTEAGPLPAVARPSVAGEIVRSSGRARSGTPPSVGERKRAIEMVACGSLV